MALWLHQQRMNQNRHHFCTLNYSASCTQMTTCLFDGVPLWVKPAPSSQTEHGSKRSCSLSKATQKGLCLGFIFSWWFLWILLSGKEGALNTSISVLIFIGYMGPRLLWLQTAPKGRQGWKWPSILDPFCLDLEGVLSTGHTNSREINTNTCA